MTHNSVSGVAHFCDRSEGECFERIRALLRHLPQNNLEDAPRWKTADDPNREDESLNELIPDSPNRAYDMRRVIETVAEEYLQELREQRIDTLVLGCTHYPLLTEIISGVMGGSVFLVDAGREAACAAQSLLLERDALAGPGLGDVRFFTSERAADFQRLAGIFLQEPCRAEAEPVDIGRY